MLISIIVLIYINVNSLYNQYLYLNFQVFLSNFKPICSTKIIFFKFYLLYIKVFKYFIVTDYRIFIIHKKNIYKCFYITFFLTINNIEKKY